MNTKWLNTTTTTTTTATTTATTTTTGAWVVVCSVRVFVT